MKTLSLKLPDSLDSQLTEAARQKGTTKSSLLREAIMAYLATSEAAEVSFAARAADLAGCVAAEVDLSSNEQHLDDYGR